MVLTVFFKSGGLSFTLDKHLEQYTLLEIHYVQVPFKSVLVDVKILCPNIWNDEVRSNEMLPLGNPWHSCM